MFVLGLTGSIGMGKTEVGRMFQRSGIPVYDADAAVHRVYAQGGAAVAPVGKLFPDAIVDGRVDRSRLSKQVLGDQEALKLLEATVHPLLQSDRDAFRREAERNDAKLAVLDIPLLFETGGEKKVDAVAVVSAAYKVQRQRVLARPGMTEEKFQAILARQVPDAEKRARADYVITTDVPLAETERRVRELVAILVKRRGKVWAENRNLEA